MNNKEIVKYPKERIRLVVLSFFLAQGFCFSSWASRIPDVKALFDVYDVFYWGLVLFLIAIGMVSSIYLLGVCLFSFGVFWNLCDISLNTQGIVIERLYGRTIMASFHGGWSLAACLGALLGFAMIVSGV